MTDVHVPPVVIPAHGPGSRMRDVTGGAPKTLVEIDGEPILRRLLRAADTIADAAVIVYARPDDRKVPDYVEGLNLSHVTVRHRPANGYLVDLMEISADVGEEFTVLDSDLMTPHNDLVRFLGSARTVHADKAFVVAVSKTPPSSDPRSIRFASADDGKVELVPGERSSIARSIGAYHWRADAVRAARSYLAETSGTFHGFVTRVPSLPWRVGLVEVSMAINVNTPADLKLARQLRGSSNHPAG